MKAKQTLLGILFVCQFSALTTGNAATLTWDSNAATAPNPYDGAGTWDTTALSFWNGTANVAWNNTTNATDTAAFGIAHPGAFNFQNAGVVGLGTATHSAGGIQFNPYAAINAKYNINNGTLNFGSNAATIAVNTLPSRPFGAINTAITGSGGITISGTGILEFGTGTNTFTGGLNLSAGSSLSVDADARLGAAANPVNFNGNSTLILRTTNTFTHNATIASGVTGSFDVLSGQTITWGSATAAISGAGNLQKSGLGALTLVGTHGYTGQTKIRQGTLTLDFSNAASPAANIVNSGSALVLTGGTLSGTGKSAATNAQTFASTTINPGASSLSLTLNSATSLAFNLGTISQTPGGTLNISSIAANTSYNTGNSNVNGILGGFATIGATSGVGGDWMSVSGGNLATYGGYTTGTDATLWTSSDNVSISATPSTPLAADSTINSLRMVAGATVAIPSGNTLTLGTGGVLVTGTSTDLISGGTLRGSASGDLIIHHYSTGATTISSVIADNGGATALTKAGPGALSLTGANTFSGPVYLNAGSLDANSDAALGTGSSVVVRQGTTLTLSGSSAINTSKNILFDFGSDSFHTTQMSATATDTGTSNLVVSNTAGVTVSGTFNVTAGTFTKKGAGNLTLTNPAGGLLGRLNGQGTAVEVQDGGLVLNGGTGSVWSVGQSEMHIGTGDNTTAASARAASLTLNSGSLVTGSWMTAGRGNGNTSLQSQITLNNASILDCSQFSMGFANGVSGYNAKPKLTMSGTSQLIVRDISNIAESTGGEVTISFTDSAQFIGRNRINFGQATNAKAIVTLAGSSVMRADQQWLGIGVGGTATINVQDSASLGCATDFNVADTNNSQATLNISGGTVSGTNVFIGKGSNNTTPAVNSTWGVINQSGGLFQYTGTSGTEWRIGGNFSNNTNVYGHYNLSGGTFDPGSRTFQIGGYGYGVMNLSGTGTVNSNGGWPSIARFANSFGALNVNGGTFNQLSTGNRLIVGELGTGQLNMSGGTINLTGNNGLLVGNGAGATGHFNFSGGSLNTKGIGTGGGTSRVYLNGGQINASAGSAATFMGGLTSSHVGPGGAKINTNGQSFAITQALLAPTGQGITSIPVATGGAGYVGQPIVSITGGGGVGATAVATVSGGVVTGFVITCPGSGYSSTPTVTLMGGGPTTAATAGSASLGSAVADGGLVKSGSGTLTLSGSSTYTGGTTINAGTLALGTASVLADTGAVTLTSGTFDVGTFSETVGAVTVSSGDITGSGILTASSFAINNTSGTTTAGAMLAGTGANLTKTGAGDLLLSKTNFYTGTTSISGGGTTSLGTAGSLDPTSSLSVASSTFDLRNGTASRNQTVNNLTLNGATLVFGMAGSGTDVLNATGTVGASGSNTIKIVGSIAPGTYDLITTGSPLSGSFTLDTSGVIAGFTSYSGAISGNNYQLTASGNATPGDAYWKGDVSASWTDASLAPANSNWATSAGGGTDTQQLPSGTTDVYFNAAGATNTVTSLGNDISIKSLTFSSGSASVIGGPQTLTLLGTNPNGYPLEVLNGGSGTINSATSYTGTTHLETGGTLTFAGGNLGASIDEIMVDGTLNVNADLTKGILSGSGTVTRSDPGSNTFSVGDASNQSFTGNIQNATGTLNLTKTGAGLLLLSGTNSDFTGNLKIAGGSLEIDNTGALMNPASIIQQPGSTFVNSANGFTVSCPYNLDLNGGTSIGVAQPGAGYGLGNYVINTPASISVNGLLTSNGGSLSKRGAGTLTLTNSGANVLANNGGIAFAVQEGDMVLNGGSGATYNVNAGELTVGDITPNACSLTLTSGTLTVGTYLSVGRGNGNTSIQSTVNLNGGTLSVPNLFTGFANGVFGYNARPVINLNGTTANVGAVRIGESQGSYSTLNLTAGALTATGIAQVGYNGTGIANCDIPITVGSLQIGAAANGVGAFRNNSTVTVTSGASTNHFHLGNNTNAYGYFRNNAGASISLVEAGIGGGAVATSTGSGGVLDVIGGTVAVSTWLTPNRGGAGQSSLINVTGGTFNTPNSGQAAINWATNQYGLINVSGTGSLVGSGANSTLDLNRTSSSDNNGLLTIGSGGTVQLTSLLATGTSGNSIVNFNGGTLKAGATAPNLIASSVTAAHIQSGGATVDTNSFDATIQEPLLAPIGSGVSGIPLSTNGAGYVGRPIVRIIGDGVGASAVADFDANTGDVTGITVTSPGSGYTTPPMVSLIGGGGTTTAVPGTATLAASATNGGLTKTGTGNLTLAGLNTYAGNTAVNGGTLTLADNAQLKFVIGANGVNNSIGGTGSLQLDGDFNIDTTTANTTSGNSWNLVSVGTLTETFGGTFTVIGFTKSGSTWTKIDGANTWSFSEATGVLSISAGGYNSWAATNAGSQASNLDYDGDGVKNGIEYFMGQTGSSFTTNPSLTSGSVTWPKSPTFSGTYRVETSTDLINWTNVTGSAVDNGSSVTYTLPTGNPKLFVHLVVIPN